MAHKAPFTPTLGTALPVTALLLFSACHGGGGSHAVQSQTPVPTSPVLTALSPATADSGSTGFTLVVDGTGFVPASQVRWNGANRATSFTSALELTAVIPSSDLALAGNAQVSVLNPAADGGASNSATFAITSTSTATLTSEFSIATPVTGDQRRPSVAALPLLGAGGTVACVLYEDNSEAHEHYRVNAFDRRGVASGTDDERSHHTEGVGYIGMAASPITNGYFEGIRYHPNTLAPEPHPQSLYLDRLESNGLNYEQVNALDTETLVPALVELDMAIDPVAGTRFLLFRVVGTSASAGTPPEGIDAVIFPGATGLTRTAAVQLSSTPSTQQHSARVAFNGSVYLVAWEDTGTIRARRFDAVGAPIGNDFTISSGPLALVPRVAANPSSDDFLVVWQQSGIKGRVVHPNATLDAEAPISTTLTGVEAPAVAANPTGAWMITWTGTDASGKGIVSRSFDAALASPSLETAVNQTTTGDQVESSVTWAAAADAWIVVWTGLDASGTGLHARFMP